MVFNSVTFFLFFVVFYNVYWLINRRFPVSGRNLITLLFSYLFYGWWDWRFLGLIVISSGADYCIGLQLGKAKRNGSRKRLLWASIMINLGILGFFKYFNFFIDSLNEFFSLFSIYLSGPTLNIILPVGISFYTFQTMSYTLDIYKGKLKPTRDIIRFFTFVAFFPQLVAGPIERASHLLPQFKDRKTFSFEKTVSGLRLVLWGLFKKIVIADNFGVLSDAFFDPSGTISGLRTILGALFFGIQIYADFSGYSDIAIGLARTLGIELMTNFRTPYFASSFREFWQRWHISLSTWFRDYVYIPLGGNRKSPPRIAVNILITFLLSGLWHGAAVTFLIWGGLHGLAYLAERNVKLNVYRSLKTSLVFSMVILFWIPFRAEDTNHLELLIRSLFHFNLHSISASLFLPEGFSLLRIAGLILVLLVFTMVESNLKDEEFNEWIGRKTKTLRWFTYYLLVFLILFLGNFDVKPYFIYFQF